MYKRQTHVFGHDGHGSVRVLYDLAGAIAQVFTFAAYGSMLAVHNGAGTLVGTSEAAALTSLGYSGEQFDAASQQQYLRARYYNPNNGRFNRLDDFAGNNQDPQSLHKYAYVHGDPITGIDPTGRSFAVNVAVAVGIGTVIGALSGGVAACYDGCTSGEFFAGVGTGALYGAIGGLLGFLSFAAISAIAGAYFSSVATFWIATFGSGFVTSGGIGAGEAIYEGKSPQEVLFTGVEQGIYGAALGGLIGIVFRGAAPIWLKFRGRPQGLSPNQFDEFSTAVREGAGEISDDIVVQGSRAQGIARRVSDADVAVKVDQNQFDQLIEDAFGDATGALARTKQHAINQGKITAGRVRHDSLPGGNGKNAGFRQLRRQLEEILGIKVDISIILKGGAFDNGPQIPTG